MPKWRKLWHLICIDIFSYCVGRSSITAVRISHCWVSFRNEKNQLSTAPPNTPEAVAQEKDVLLEHNHRGGSALRNDQSAGYGTMAENGDGTRARRRKITPKRHVTFDPTTWEQHGRLILLSSMCFQSSQRGAITCARSRATVSHWFTHIHTHTHARTHTVCTNRIVYASMRTTRYHYCITTPLAEDSVVPEKDLYGNYWRCCAEILTHSLGLNQLVSNKRSALYYIIYMKLRCYSERALLRCGLQ